jgi:putative FmdB family regulatory protein
MVYANGELGYTSRLLNIPLNELGNAREMPIYEYQCGDCQHSLEALQKMADAPLTDCPECGKPGLVKKVSAAGFRLSGSGWYETDFKSGNKKNLASNSSSSDSSSSA